MITEPQDIIQVITDLMLENIMAEETLIEAMCMVMLMVLMTALTTEDTADTALASITDMDQHTTEEH